MDDGMITTPIAIDVPLWTDERGKIRIGDTRVLLELVIHAFWQGETAEGIVDSYPTLTLALRTRLHTLRDEERCSN